MNLLQRIKNVWYLSEQVEREEARILRKKEKAVFIEQNRVEEIMKGKKDVSIDDVLTS